MNDVMLAQMADGPSAFGPVLMMTAIFAIFYFLVIRPQQKREKEKEDFRSRLKRGDEVIAGGGIYGRVVDLKGPIVWVELAANVRVKVDRRSLEAATPRAAKPEEKEAGAS
jgi:preprotein translocase subunit YajC